MNLDLIFLVIFGIVLYIFFKLNRSKFEVQGKIIALYKTKGGVKVMDKLSKVPKFIMHPLAFISILVGFIGMGMIFYILIGGTISLLTVPGAQPTVAPVLPGVSIPGVPNLSFFHWIISILIVATIHEFSHGILARYFLIKVKSTGFLIMGPVLGAFVEPDEKQLAKKSRFAQLSVFSAGPFSNILTGFIFLLILSLIIAPAISGMTESLGVTVVGTDKGFPAELAGLTSGEKILSIDSKQISNVDDFTKILQLKKPGDKISIKTDKKTYDVTLTKNPTDSNKGYMGIRVIATDTKIKDSVITKYGTFWPNALKWIERLFYWLFLISTGIALFNLLPLGPVDGGRMFLTGLSFIFKDPKIQKRVWGTISIFVLLLIFINLWPFISKLLGFIFSPLLSLLSLL